MTGARALVLGCGYVGLELVRVLRERGVEVTATARTQARLAEIEAAGANAVIADAVEPATLRPLRQLGADVVFDLIRPQQIDDDRYTAWGTRNIAAAFAGKPLQAFVYLSSTAVYGAASGDWTDEATTAEPNSSIGHARLEAEEIYLDHHHRTGFPVRICRASRVYGPGRTLRERLETGAYRRADDESHWISPIHVTDLCEGLIAAWQRGEAGQRYLLCDDEPTTGQEYAELTASLLALPLPPTVEREDIRQEASSDAIERRAIERKCSNRRMREELGVHLVYPTVREGIPAALRAEGAL